MKHSNPCVMLIHAFDRPRFRSDTVFTIYCIGTYQYLKGMTLTHRALDIFDMKILKMMVSICKILDATVNLFSRSSDTLFV